MNKKPILSAVCAGLLFSVTGNVYAADISDPIKISGGIAQKAMKGISDHNTYWEKALWLNIDGTMSNGWRGHAELDWKYGSNEGFNSEKSSSDDYVGDSSPVKVAGSIWKVYAAGPIAKNTELKFGHFTPSLQKGYVSNARVYGGELSYQPDANTTIKAYGGKLREKKWDLAEQGNQGFVRNGGNGTNRGCDDNGSDVPTAYGLSFEHTFNDKLAGGLGYYNYKTIAYDNDTLHIGVIDGSYKMSDAWGVTGFYARGSKGYQSNAGDVKFTYNGSPWGGRKFGGYIGYRYLGADAIIMSSIVHGSEKGGAKGLEAGLWYRFTPNILLTNDLFFGRAINQDFVAGDPGTHTAFFSALNFTF